MPKEIRLNITHFFIVKILKVQQFEQIAFYYSLDIGYGVLMIYRDRWWYEHFCGMFIGGGVFGVMLSGSGGVQKFLRDSVVV